MLSEARLTKILGLKKSMQTKENHHFLKNLIVMTKFRHLSNGQNSLTFF